MEEKKQQHLYDLLRRSPASWLRETENAHDVIPPAQVLEQLQAMRTADSGSVWTINQSPRATMTSAFLSDDMLLFGSRFAQ